MNDNETASVNESAKKALRWRGRSSQIWPSKLESDYTCLSSAEDDSETDETDHESDGGDRTPNKSQLHSGSHLKLWRNLFSLNGLVCFRQTLLMNMNASYIQLINSHSLNMFF